MDTWEFHFREKSRRRFRSRTHIKIAKAAVLALIAAEVVVIAVMLMR